MRAQAVDLGALGGHQAARTRAPPGHAITSAAPGGPATTHPIKSYLAEIAAALPGPGRARAGVVAELRSGLLDAADAHRRAGLDPPAAARAAVAEFGHPAQVVAAFRPRISATQARHVAITLLATGR